VRAWQARARWQSNGELSEDLVHLGNTQQPVKEEAEAQPTDRATADQLRERWEVIVARAEKHMEKLCAYREKKRQDRLRRHRQQHRSFASVSALFGLSNNTKREHPYHTLTRERLCPDTERG
jgi:hypothetical protein